MSIYPDRKLIPTSTGYIEEISTPGLVRRRELHGTDWTEVRSDCFCCSCDPESSSTSDPACRNHGWAAERPCEKHGMPGAAYDDGEMPESVQAVRARAHTD